MIRGLDLHIGLEWTLYPYGRLLKRAMAPLKVRKVVQPRLVIRQMLVSAPQFKTLHERQQALTSSKILYGSKYRRFVYVVIFLVKRRRHLQPIPRVGIAIA